MQGEGVDSEAARLAALRACGVLDTPRESAYDSIVFTAAQLFRVPMAIMAMIDADRVWAKAAVGPVLREGPRNEAFCSRLIGQKTMLVIEDSATDDRFTQFGVSGGDGPARFSASAPVFGPGGQVVGTLAVLDMHPRSVPDRQRIQLIQLARDTDELLRLRVQASRPYF